MANSYWFQTEQDDETHSQVVTDDGDKKPEQRLCCAICGAYITDDRFKTQINGQHAHTKINPQNHQFTFASYSEAPGCSRHGELTHADTWFAGYRWRFAHCKNCTAQLGWQFYGERIFYGLIMEQLVNCEEEQQ